MLWGYSRLPCKRKAYIVSFSFPSSACLDTIIENMEIVSRFGPRKHLPPDHILQTILVRRIHELVFI
ncbi:unnamed protein product [Heterobilharzia americana]|nr:unnamed protein product [Heterobilharzia americana]